ncbi:glutamine--tRNA ligase (plasmid) [Aquincola tertiaricarbonis]|jgi:glutaminyl-tRNA synthetase|uniref:Glutamine--tRNA ligase n=1 Tax=Aquincola tertiaricarbonis TaxID=391953 RepID=A0ABY4SGL6_AQUTE|nr:glutamine--tRNA ligase [Aquincola tertiaricarbonis]URI12118.1 glutamine--tRNA ligase [Aquincola tertiaricarbonis]
MSPDPEHPPHFLRAAIERDLADGTYAARRWAGSPGDAVHHASGDRDPMPVRTRFPPEPNGHLHIGHAKSIGLNFGLAREFGGVCHLRMDDTNPEKEEQAYVEGIVEMVRWLGWNWGAGDTQHLYHASDYFEFMYRAAEALVSDGLAYVDEQSGDELRASRGDYASAGVASPWRDRPREESLARLREMRKGRHPDGSMVLRARIDLASPNLQLRDPVLYRIRHVPHHRTGSAWCIYPAYIYAHPIEDALECITHSIATLEFVEHGAFYDWLLAHLVRLGLVQAPPPRQYEFGRLNLTRTVTSKRKLKALVDEGFVDGWDDPRLPTLAGLRRRGFTAAAVRNFVEATGASRHAAWVPYEALEQALRDDLDERAPRAMAVINPLPLDLQNWAEEFGTLTSVPCTAPVHPMHPQRGLRHFGLGPRLWIDRADFEAEPSKGFRRLAPGRRVRLKYGLIVECTGFQRAAGGEVESVQARIVPGSRSGTPGADAHKVSATITWLAQHDAVAAELHLLEPLFGVERPDEGEADFRSLVNPDSRRIARGFVEPTLATAGPGHHVQLERLGYFVADLHRHRAGTPVFNRSTALRSSLPG